MRVHRGARQHAIRRAASPRSRSAAVAGTLAVGGLLLGALVGPVTAQASPETGSPIVAHAVAVQAAPATTSAGQAKFTVNPATDIKVQQDKNTAITVKGSGLDPQLSLWIAVCQSDSDVPQDLTQCLGGPIPDENASTSWAVISPDQGGTPPGPVQGAIDDGGKFSVTLQLAGIADAGADCQAGDCSVVIREADSDQGLLVPVTFDAPGAGSSASSSSSSAASTTPTSTTPTSTTPTSTTPTTTAPVPTTVDAASILLPKVRAGASQVVIFDGFTPGEAVTASLAGNEQVEFPELTADDGGSVRVEWAVPANFPAARYSLRVEGADSLRVGVADFEVIAAVVSSSSSSASSQSSSASSSSSSSTSSSPSSSSTSASSTPSSTRSSSSSVPVSSTAVTTTDSVATPVESSSTPWWLWITLGLLLIAGLVVAAVLMGRQHRQQALKEQRARERELASAAETQQSLIPMPPTPAPPTPPAGLGEYAEDPQRPILFSHRQAENYTPPTDPIGDAPTQQIDPRSLPTQAIPPQPGTGSARKPMADPGPATGAWTPDFTGTQPPADPGPGTQQFNPFADDADGPGAPGPDAGSPPDPGPGTQQFDPFADDADSAPGEGSGADGDETGPKHSADDWDTPPPPR